MEQNKYTEITIAFYSWFVMAILFLIGNDFVVNIPVAIAFISANTFIAAKFIVRAINRADK